MGLSSGKLFVLGTRSFYGMFLMRLYKKSSRWKSVFEHILPPASHWFMLRNFITMHGAKTQFSLNRLNKRFYAFAHSLRH